MALAMALHLGPASLGSSAAQVPSASPLLHGFVSGIRHHSASRKPLSRPFPPQGLPHRSRASSVRASSAANVAFQHPRVGADGSQSGTSAQELMAAAEAAARRGAAVILAAVDKPREITYKGATDLVTDTDRNTEEAVLAEIRERYPNHLVLGEEGGVSGDEASDYLWCVDPLDGTTNFAHGYPCFATSVAVLFRGRPIAACVVEFAGGPHCWVTRTFTACSGGGAFCDGEPITVSTTESVGRSLLVTGFGYEHDEAWAANIELFKHFTDVSRGVRRLGAAAVDMCHVALGVVDAYWEYRLKPWDMAAGVLIVEEAGGAVTRMDGEAFSVFDRSVVVSNGHLHSQLMDKIAPATLGLKAARTFEDAHWFKPEGYVSDV